MVVGEKLRSLEKAHVSGLDVTSMTSINTFKLKVGEGPVDILLNIAGKLYQSGGLQLFEISPGVMAPKEKGSLATTNHAVLEKTFAVNAFGRLLLTQALLPHILKVFSPKIGNMVSSLGLGRVLRSLMCNYSLLELDQ